MFLFLLFLPFHSCSSFFPVPLFHLFYYLMSHFSLSLGDGGWSGVAMASFILRHRGVQLKLAYSWARPAILVAGKGRGGMFLFPVSSLSFLFLFLP